ncbi:MAG TPA: hypothetical protein PLD74_07180 [Prolixibacteraceae bacterium]|nr:hypothetical protein [Prolixibacteraceae bacterium]HOC85393.1 hypothetical protein [Prolixibacteraceae bacterium]HOG94759.1 hypothetical protein [Prolixibacteraceae bacterium]HOR99212.1 hypothetical protein [Prolixibacteraceae bacterium]HOS90052.1 hypothetical protein [Prolixibacteraceae bacterium]
MNEKISEGVLNREEDKVTSTLFMKPFREPGAASLMCSGQKTGALVRELPKELLIL